MQKDSKAFSLIELIAVVGVIAVLVTIGIPLFNNVLAKSRDARRITELRSIEAALKLYASSHDGDYPVADSGEIIDAASTLVDALVPEYLIKMPYDPKDSSFAYYYQTAASGAYYKLAAYMENDLDAAQADRGTAEHFYEIYNDQGFRINIEAEAICLLMPQPSSCPSYLSGLVGHWDFEEGKGSIAYDISGNNNNGSWYGTGSHYVTDSQVGDFAGEFNGTSDYVNCGNGANLNITSTVTIAAWIKSNNSSQPWCTVVGKGFESTANYSFEANSNWIRLTIGNGSSYAGDLTYYYPTIGQWFHMVGVFITTGSTTKKYRYINGVLNGNNNANWPLTTGVASFGIGHSNTNGYYNGFIDDVRVYNRALSSDEILALYNETR